MKRNKIEKKLVKEKKNIFFNLIFAFATLLLTVIFYKNVFLLSILLLSLSLIGLIKWKSRITLFIYFLIGIFGPLSEMIAVYFNAWQYSIPNIMNVPLWLFLVWGNAGAFIYQTAIELERLGVHKKW